MMFFAAGLWPKKITTWKFGFACASFFARSTFTYGRGRSCKNGSSQVVPSIPESRSRMKKAITFLNNEEEDFLRNKNCCLWSHVGANCMTTTMECQRKSNWIIIIIMIIMARPKRVTCRKLDLDLSLQFAKCRPRLHELELTEKNAQKQTVHLVSDRMGILMKLWVLFTFFGRIRESRVETNCLTAKNQIQLFNTRSDPSRRDSGT
jgi:hypothetical protein